MSETSLHDISLSRFARRMLRINVAVPLEYKLDRLHPRSPFYVARAEKYHPAIFHTCDPVEALLVAALTEERLTTTQSAARCRSWLPRAIRAAQRLTSPTKAERRRVPDEVIFNRLQSLLHRGLDSNVGRRA
jgi:hypothetical protein